MANIKREQPRKDNNSKRVNFDNESEKKFDKEYKPRGKRPKNKNKRGGGPKKKQDEVTKENKRVSNDASWYSKSPELVKAAGSLPFASIAGGTRVCEDTTVPGVMIINYVHNFEMASDKNAMRQAFDSQYSFIVHANSRNQSYDAVDLGVMEMAGMECFSSIAHLIRAYGFARHYEEENMYNGKILLRAMGFDPEDFYNKLGQIWFDINLLIDRSRQIWIPNTMPLLARWLWMNSTVFTDAEGKRAQYYLYVPTCFYKFTDHVGDKVGSGLIQAGDKTNTRLFAPGYWVTPWAGQTSESFQTNEFNAYNWEMWKSIINQQLDALIDSSDRGMIMGDILKAYGSDKIFALPPIPADYKLAPVYNPEVLTQIENTTIVPGYKPGAYVQDFGKFLRPIMTKNDTFASSPKWTGFYQTPWKPIINFHQADQPTPDQIMVATRMMSVGSYTKQRDCLTVANIVLNQSSAFQTQYQVIPNVTGSEIATGILTMRYSYNTGAPSVSNCYYGTSTLTTEQDVAPKFTGLWCVNVMPFDWSPAFYCFRTVASPLSEGSYNAQIVTYYGALTEFDNYIVTNEEEIRKLHDVAIFSLLDVPTI